MKDIVDNEQTVIRYPPLGIVLFATSCAAFAVWGVYTLLVERDDVFLLVVAIGAIAFFGFGGAFALPKMARKPMAIVSAKGVTVPGWRESFVPWSNIREIKIVEQQVHNAKIKYIGVFTRGFGDVAEKGKTSESTGQRATVESETPDLQIVSYFSLVRREKIMDILQSYQKQYALENEDIDESGDKAVSKNASQRDTEDGHPYEEAL
ncbi:MAG: hypothetical protein FWC20_11610 [Oscillospiraceae bacterium]|nr:hypothetical protein [Oscillospiraceae bacterium]MCL2280030.1 hypothetical protein [Oscillospiraceae bacterium]